MVFEAAQPLGTEAQQYDLTPFIGGVRQRVDRWRELPDPNCWQVTPETARLLRHWRSHRFGDIRPFFRHERTGKRSQRRFWAGPHDQFTDTGRKAIRERIAPLFDEAKQEYRAIFGGGEKIDLSDRALGSRYMAPHGGARLATSKAKAA